MYYSRRLVELVPEWAIEGQPVQQVADTLGANQPSMAVQRQKSAGFSGGR